MATAGEREDLLRRQLIADGAHEDRTPLTILRAKTEGLVDGVLPADPATLASLHEEVLRLTQLVTDLETLAAADAAGLQLERAPIELGDVASDVVDAVAGVVSERNLSITTRLDPAPAEADERRIHQIVTNLVANAVRYSPPAASLTIETGCFSDGNVFVRFTDSGPGLADAYLDHVFAPFYRGSPAPDSDDPP